MCSRKVYGLLAERMLHNRQLHFKVESKDYNTSEYVHLTFTDSKIIIARKFELQPNR